MDESNVVPTGGRGLQPRVGPAYLMDTSHSTRDGSRTHNCWHLRLAEDPGFEPEHPVTGGLVLAGRRLTISTNLPLESGVGFEPTSSGLQPDTWIHSATQTVAEDTGFEPAHPVGWPPGSSRARCHSANPPWLRARESNSHWGNPDLGVRDRYDAILSALNITTSFLPVVCGGTWDRTRTARKCRLPPSKRVPYHSAIPPNMWEVGPNSNMTGIN